MSRAAIAASLVSIAGVAYAVAGQRDDRLETARSAESIIADKLEPRRARSRQRLLALYRASSVTRSIFDPASRWQRLRARADLVRVVRRDLAELEALERELSRVSAAADELERAPEPAPRPELIRPVDGAAVVADFGPYRSAPRVTSVRRGVELEVAPGAAVRAPIAGRVVFSGPVRHLGRAAVIEAGGHWVVLGPVDLDRPQGAAVSAGEVVGKSIRERLYLELRRIDEHGGRPLDPRPMRDPP